MNLDKDIFELWESRPGNTVRIKSIGSTHLQRVLGEMGVSIGSDISCLFYAPFQGPGAYQSGEIQFALRQEDAKIILVQHIPA